MRTERYISEESFETEEYEICPLCGNRLKPGADYCESCEAAMDKEISNFIADFRKMFEIDKYAAAVDLLLCKLENAC